MKSIRVNYDQSSDAVDRIENVSPEPWQEVCERYDNDVARIRSVTDQEGFTGLFACYDENNRPVYYLVEEDDKLARLRRKTFLSKLGKSEG